MSKIENIILVIALLWLSFGIIDYFNADTEIDYSSYDGFISSTEDLANSIIEKNDLEYASSDKIPYWISGVSLNDNVWIKVPSLPAATTCELWILKNDGYHPDLDKVMGYDDSSTYSNADLAEAELSKMFLSDRITISVEVICMELGSYRVHITNNGYEMIIDQQVPIPVTELDISSVDESLVVLE